MQEILHSSIFVRLCDSLVSIQIDYLIFLTIRDVYFREPFKDRIFISNKTTSILNTCRSSGVAIPRRRTCGAAISRRRNCGADIYRTAL